MASLKSDLSPASKPAWPPLRTAAASLADALLVAAMLALSAAAVLSIAVIAPIAVLLSSLPGPFGAEKRRRGAWRAAPAH